MTTTETIAAKRDGGMTAEEVAELREMFRELREAFNGLRGAIEEGRR